MIVSETERLRIRAWKEADRDLFFEINNDAEVMAFFPHRRNREETDALFDRVGQGIAETGLGFFAVARETYEYTQMYPGMAKTAREEGFAELAEWFETLAKAERSHANRFQKGLDSLKS